MSVKYTLSPGPTARHRVSQCVASVKHGAMKRQAEKAKRRRRPWARVIVDEIRRSEVDAATEVLRIDCLHSRQPPQNSCIQRIKARLIYISR